MIGQRNNVCDALLRRSVENHFMTYRHNRREKEMLEERFASFQRRIHLVDHSIEKAERRFEQHAKTELGLMISSRRKDLVPSKGNQFYYPTTLKNWAIKDFVVEPIQNVIQQQNRCASVLRHHRRNYNDVLQRKAQIQRVQKEKFLDQTEILVREDYPIPNNDWPISDNARLTLPKIGRTRSPEKVPGTYLLQNKLLYP